MGLSIWLEFDPEPVVGMPRRNAAMSRPKAFLRVLEELEAGVVNVPSKKNCPP